MQTKTALIRPAQSADIPDLLPMLGKLCILHKTWNLDRYDFLPNVEQLYGSWLNDLLTKPQHLCLVAELAAEARSPASNNAPRLAAVIIATLEQEIPIYHLTDYGLIHDLWVEEAYRNQGIARRLIQQTMIHFRQLEVRQIRLSTVLPNDHARRLYASCGFRPSTIEMILPL